MKIKDVYIENVIIISKFGIEITQTENVTFNNVRIYPEQGPKLTARHSFNILMDGKALSDSHSTPVNIE